MSNYPVIHDVGDTLKRLLWENMRADPKFPSGIIDDRDEIGLVSPQDMEAGSAKKLSLFLYRITECPYLKNQEMQSSNSGKLKRTPLALILSYLITPNTDDSKRDHILLGKVMQIFHDNAIVKGSILRGTLEGTTEELRVTFYSLPSEEMIHLWQSFSEKSFKLSVCYQVGPVSIDSTREMDAKRVVEKQAAYHQAFVKKEK